MNFNLAYLNKSCRCGKTIIKYINYEWFYYFYIENKRKGLYKMRKFKKNSNNGITLIALIITIIVLLILAGVSIAMLTGDNGILTQAKTNY